MWSHVLLDSCSIRNCYGLIYLCACLFVILFIQLFMYSSVAGFTFSDCHSNAITARLQLEHLLLFSVHKSYHLVEV